jgi:hypothetical protein
MGFCNGFAACYEKLSPQKKSWHQVRAVMRKNVATCDIFVAIEDFVATFWFSWQQPITMLAIATPGNEHNVVAIGTYCDYLPLIATNIVVAIDRNPCSDGMVILGWLISLN